MMQFLYKLFVSEKELANSLPIMFTDRGTEYLSKFIKSRRKYLFVRKVKKAFSFKKRALPPGHKGDE